MEHYYRYYLPPPLLTITSDETETFGKRGHDFILPAVKTERFKRSFFLIRLCCHVCNATRMLWLSDFG